MEYTGYELLWIFVIYGVIGWSLEVSAAAVKRRRFLNMGYLSGPFSPIYAISEVAFAILLPELRAHPLFLFLGGMLVASFIEYVSGWCLERIFGRKWWDYSDQQFQVNGYVCLKNSMVWGIGALLSIELCNRLFLRLVHLIPHAIGRLILWGVLIALILDEIGSSAAVFQMHHRLRRVAFQVSVDLQKLSDSLGNALTRRIQNRMVKAYPSLSVEELLNEREIRKEKRKARDAAIFAQGCSFYKLAALFLIGAFLGDIVETIFCYVTAGIWMSRSSVVWGPFSIVWGFGCVLLTAFLYQYRDRSDRVIFLAGTVLGGAYEYICSVASELVFGTVFWDYSKIPFNLGGRINLLYCFFWGIVSVVWLKMIYPFLSKHIERIPKKWGVIGCNLLLLFMVVNMAVSAFALERYARRQEHPTPAWAVDVILDEHFPDERMERVYPNAKIVR